MKKYYRIQINKKGLYEELDRIDPDHKKRKKGPSDKWYPHVPTADYPGADFWWTEKGFNEYKKRGIFGFHQSLIKDTLEIQVGTEPKEIVYKDEFQIAAKGDLKMLD